MINNNRARFNIKGKKMLNQLKKTLKTLAAIALGHRVIYGLLSFAHANGCVMTDYPELYAPMAALYAILAWRG